MQNQEVKEPDMSYGDYTYADYLNFDFEEMVEIIKGKIYKMSPAPKTIHQIVSRNLGLEIGNFLKGKRCQFFVAPFDVILPVADKKRERATTVVQPDIVVICNPELIEDRGCFGVPDWVVEILSPHTKKKDLQLKFDVYEEAGVKEYWIITAEEQMVEVFVLENGKYQRTTTYVKEDTVTPVTLPDLHRDLADVFEG